MPSIEIQSERTAMNPPSRYQKVPSSISKPEDSSTSPIDARNATRDCLRNSQIVYHCKDKRKIAYCGKICSEKTKTIGKPKYPVITVPSCPQLHQNAPCLPKPAHPVRPCCCAPADVAHARIYPPAFETSHIAPCYTKVRRPPQDLKPRAG